MTLARSSRRFIENGNYEALEDEWLAELTEESLDLEYFIGTSRALAASGQEELTRHLLELVDEQLVSEECWNRRLALLEGCGKLLFPAQQLHNEILESLRGLHPESDIREQLIEKLGLRRAIHDTAKTWQKAHRFRGLMRFDRGAVVWMEGKGAGTIEDVNVELEKLRVKLADAMVSVGFGAADKMLRPLSEEHFYTRKLRDPDTLADLARENPPRLLQLLLESENEALSASTIRAAVRGVVPDTAWTSWWSSARSHPQILASGKGAQQVYRWLSTHQEVSDEAVRLFDEANLQHKLEIYRRESKRSAASQGEMHRRLLQIATESVEEDPAGAFAIGATLQQADADLPPELAPEHLIATADHPTTLVRSIDDKVLRRRALAVLRDCRDDWPPLFARLFEYETEPRLLSDLAQAIAEHDPSLLATSFDAIVAHPRRRAAAFVWLAEHLTSFPFLEERNPMQLMQLVLRVGTAREFNPFRPRLRKLIETSEILPHLVARLQPDQAEQAEMLLIKAPIEDYVRQPLINALHLRFPDSFARESDALYATADSIAARRRDLKRLLEEEIPANRRAIEEARALGDLRENFEYKAARQRHEYLTARASALEGDLRRARPIDFSRVDAVEVRVGCRVSLATETGIIEFSILGPWESDPDAGVLSYESETAKRLLGRRPGDQVRIGESTWQVESIAPLSG